jgi:hypothetical protein
MKRAFISFDFDHDSGIKTLLVGQAKNPDTPFNIADFSVKEAIAADWKLKVRTKIKSCDIVIVLCGEFTHTASGVSTELSIAQQENVPYFLLKGYSEKYCTRPTSAKATDKVYDWTWPNLKILIGGGR